MWLATELERGGKVERVYYPGLESHPDHAIAKRQMKMFGGMVCLDLGGGYERAARFFDRLKIVKRAASLGGVESLCSLPILTSQWGHSAEELERAGVTASMARLSIGLEDPEDLLADIEQALVVGQGSDSRFGTQDSQKRLSCWNRELREPRAPTRLAAELRARAQTTEAPEPRTLNPEPVSRILSIT